MPLRVSQDKHLGQKPVVVNVTGAGGATGSTRKCRWQMPASLVWLQHFQYRIAVHLIVCVHTAEEKIVLCAHYSTVIARILRYKDPLLRAVIARVMKDCSQATTESSPTASGDMPFCLKIIRTRGWL